MNIKKSIKEFFDKCSIEASETKDAFINLGKYTVSDLTPEEEESMKNQFIDLLKITGIVIPAAIIPGSSILIPLLVTVAKKKGINILPSSFNEHIVFEKVDGEIEIGDLIIYEIKNVHNGPIIKQNMYIVKSIDDDFVICNDYTFNVKLLNIKKSKVMVYDENNNFIREIPKSEYIHIL